MNIILTAQSSKNKAVLNTLSNSNKTIGQKNLTLVLAHIAGWFVFLLLPGFFKFPHRGDREISLLGDLLMMHRLRNAAFLLFVFYFNYFIAIPQLYFKRKYLVFAVSGIGYALLLILVNYPFRPHDMPSGNIIGGVFGPSHNFFMLITVYFFSLALALYNQLKKTTEEKMSAEISFLKAQINPHFLFNTLNSIYSLTLSKSDQAPEAVVKLSSLMRYSVTDSEQAQVPLAKEIDYISNYISLQKLRLSENIHVKFEVKGTGEGIYIEPFMLIPFVENAFKHGVNSEEDSNISVKIDVTDIYLRMEVFNNKVYSEKTDESGLGIDNTRKRLEILYPGKYILAINDTDDYFNVLLQINIG